MKKPLKKSHRKQPHNLAPQIALIAFIISAIGYYAFSRLPKPQQIGINEISSVIPKSVKLAFEPAPATSLGTQISANLMIDTGGLSVSAVQVELTYDPASLSNMTVSQGDFLSEKLGNPKVAAGKIAFTYVIPLEVKGKSGSGKLATLNFKQLKPSAQIAFSSNTMVAAIGSNENVLSSATGVTLTNSRESTQPTAPILTDIRPTPSFSPTSVKEVKTEIKKSGVSAVQKNETATNANKRTYDESGNFDYTKSQTQTPIDELESSTYQETSSFAKFLAKIRSYFGHK